jgi:hypothetical protein
MKHPLPIGTRVHHRGDVMTATESELSRRLEIAQRALVDMRLRLLLVTDSAPLRTEGSDAFRACLQKALEQSSRS